MAEFLLFIALFIGIMLISALIFGGWFIVMILRGIARLLGIAPAPQQLQGRRASGAVQIGPPSTTRHGRYCPFPLCRAPNAAEARFCRRCGRALPPLQRVVARRVAIL